MMTGWEHDVADNDTVLRQWVLTNLTRFRTMVERVGGRIDVWDAAAIFDTGSPLVFDNAVMLRRPVSIDELEEIIDTAHVFFAGERPWLFVSAWPLPDLTTSGLSLMGHPPFMMRPAGAPIEPTPEPAGVEIREVTAAEMASFGATLEKGYGLPGASQSPWGDSRSLGTDMRAYIGYLDGEPVSTAAAFLAHDVVDVEMVSCLENCRGRGIGKAMTWAATLADPTRPAMLMASDPGRPVYERMGYFAVTRMTLWFSTPGDGVNR